MLDSSQNFYVEILDPKVLGFGDFVLIEIDSITDFIQILPILHVITYEHLCQF